MSSINVRWAQVSASILAAGLWVGVGASQTAPTASKAPFKRLSGPQTKNPGAWPYTDAYDSVAAAGEIHHVRYEDEHIRLIEVAYFPGVHGNMHGHPYPSVFAYDAAVPKNITNVTLDAGSPMNNPTGGNAPPPQGMQYPTCSAMGPQAPHAVTNNDTFPLHFFRVEFKRVDGDDYKTKWKTWYPWMLLPLKPLANIDPTDPKLGPPVSKEYPYAPRRNLTRPRRTIIRFVTKTITSSFSKSRSGTTREKICMVTRAPPCLRATSARPR